MNIELYNNNKPKVGWNWYKGHIVLESNYYYFMFLFIKTSDRNKDYDVVWIQESPMDSTEIGKNIFNFIDLTTKN